MSADPTQIELSFLVALIGIKIRILSDLETKANKFNNFVSKLNKANPKTAAADLSECHTAIDCMQLYIMGDPKKHDQEVRRQEDQLQNYLMHARKSNNGILPALLNSQPIMKQPKPTTFTRGSPDEVRMLMEYGEKFFMTFCPGVQQRIKKFLDACQ